MDKGTLKDIYFLYRDEMNGDQPYYADELIISHLLALGYDSPTAHTMLCTVSCLYDIGAEIL